MDTVVKYLKLSLLYMCLFFSIPRVFAADSCAPLLPGETLVFSGTGSRGTPVDAEYTLSRSADDPNRFTAALRLRFTFMTTAAPVEIGDASWAQRQQDLEKEVRVCLANVNPHLTGPGGNQLDIKLQSDSALATGPVTPIKVYDKLTRSNQNSWPAHPDCEIVTHEILHVLGLVDGYEEEDGYGFMFGKVTQRLYDCRSLAPEDSVMREPYQTLQAGQSLLYEEEFKTITAGKDCSVASSKYLECAQNARLTSHLFLGVRQGCMEVAPYCRSTEWLGTKDVELTKLNQEMR